MQINKERYLNRFQKKNQEDWQALGELMTKYYKKNCFWLCWKFPLSKLSRVFHEQEKKGDTEFRNLMQKLHHE